jgi:hypothetical protein
VVKAVIVIKEKTMSDSNPSNPAAANRAGMGGAAAPQAPDFQQLVALLGNLMPLLLRFQTQVLEPSPLGPGYPPAPEAQLDHQAAVALTEDMIAGLLRRLSAYLDANAGQNAGLNNCVPIVAQATQSLAARNYAQAFNLIWMAYRAITTIGAADSRLPPLRGQTAADERSSVH